MPVQAKDLRVGLVLRYRGPRAVIPGSEEHVNVLVRVHEIRGEGPGLSISVTWLDTMQISGHVLLEGNSSAELFSDTTPLKHLLSPVEPDQAAEWMERQIHKMEHRELPALDKKIAQIEAGKDRLRRAIAELSEFRRAVLPTDSDVAGPTDDLESSQP